MLAIIFLLEFQVCCTRMENDQLNNHKINSKAATSGYFGQLSYYFSNNKLELTGSGDMISNYGNKAPWKSFSSEIYYLSISSSITSIGEYAFINTALKTVTLPNGIIRIEEYAFFDIKTLSKVILPETLEYIGNNAFYNTGLTSIDIPEGVVTIKSLAFEYTGITSITLPSTLEELDSLSLNAGQLIEINVNENSEYFESQNNVLYTKDKNALVLYASQKDDVEFKIPDTVIYTYGYAFYNCSKLINLTTSKNMENINSFSFIGFTSLTNINIISEIRTVGESAFHNCYNLTSLKLPESVWNIEMNAFYNCKSLVSITLHDGIQIIGSGTFSECHNLKSVYLPRDINRIERSLFFGCKVLRQ